MKKADFFTNSEEILRAFDSEDTVKENSDDAHRRRFNLALRCITYVLPIWKNTYPDDEGVNRMLALAQKALENKVEKESAKKTAYNYWSEVDSLEAETENQLRAASVGYASINVVYVAVRDEIFNENMEDDFDEDPFIWDTSFHSFLAYTGFGGENPEGIEKNREFWRWYLDEAVPEAYQSIN